MRDIYTLVKANGEVCRSEISPKDILSILKKRGTNGIVAVVRRNQKAILLGDTVAFVDVDVPHPTRFLHEHLFTKSEEA